MAQYIKRSLAWMGAGSLTGMAITWAVIVVSAWLPTPVEYGLVVPLGLVIGFSLSVTEPCIGRPIIQSDESFIAHANAAHPPLFPYHDGSRTCYGRRASEQLLRTEEYCPEAVSKHHFLSLGACNFLAEGQPRLAGMFPHRIGGRFESDAAMHCDG